MSGTVQGIPYPADAAPQAACVGEACLPAVPPEEVTKAAGLKGEGTASAAGRLPEEGRPQASEVEETPEGRR